MSKKVLKIVCILIFVLCTLITNRSYADKEWPTYSYKKGSKHYVSETGRYAYSEEGDEIIEKERSVYTWSRFVGKRSNRPIDW